MLIYLPIAEISVDVFLVLGLAVGVGFLSGLFGVGGGLLMAPLLMLIGIPPTIAVGSEVAQIVASSVSGVLAHARRGTVDYRMGGALLAGGLVGSSLAVWGFAALRRAGQIDLVIVLAYIATLGAIGGLMLAEALRTLRGVRPARPAAGKLHQHTWLHGLPFKLRFPRSRLYISALLPFALGAAVGVLPAVMGVGGGFILVPAMVYLLGMPTAVVVGTSLLAIVVVAANVTLLQAFANQSVDMVLALLLLVGSVIGAQIGGRLGQRLRGDRLRGLMAVMVLAVAATLARGLLAAPPDVFAAGRA